jgi:formiminoglutamase
MIDVQNLLSAYIPNEQRVAGSDHRFGSLLGQNTNSEQVVFALLGFPCDIGVARNGGRVGASAAPDVIRSWLYKLTPDAQMFERQNALFRRGIDLGNIICGDSLEENQEHLSKVIASLLARKIIPIILGGGHETSYGHYLGYAQSGQSVWALNIDAHPDVRELKEGLGHSGSPFRQALESPLCPLAEYTVFGLAPHGCAAAHLAYLDERQARYRWSHQMSEGEIERFFLHRTNSGFVSFDLDALDQAIAPGVSRPNENGMDKSIWFEAAFLAGKTPFVRSIDIVEHNPSYDHDAATARIAAFTIWQFLRGLSLRN